MTAGDGCLPGCAVALQIQRVANGFEFELRHFTLRRLKHANVLVRWRPDRRISRAEKQNAICPGSGAKV